MAIAKLGPIIQQIIGTVGAVTFRPSGSTTIVTPRARRTPNNSAAQIEAQRVQIHHMHVWDLTTNSRRLEWTNFARSQTWVNRLGIGRHPTGRQCFLYYAGIIDPLGVYPYYAWSPVLGGESIAPTISSLAFAASGACNVVVSNWPGANVFERGTITFPLQYGNRRTTGIRTPLSTLIRSGATANWRTIIDASGRVLTAGDVVEVKFRWRQDDRSFGQAAIGQTTVTA